MAKKSKAITRKDFIKKSSAGILGASVLASTPLKLFPAEGNLTETDIGSTGLRSTCLGMGATRTQEPNIVKNAIDGGITFLDTGRSYARGKNEEMIGKVIGGIRQNLVIQSKVKIRQEEIEKKVKNESMDKVVQGIYTKSLEESLKALQTDYIDIMLFHGADDTSILFHEAVIRAFHDSKEEGKIRATGFSTHDNMVAMVEHNNKDPQYDVIMPAFNHSGGYAHSDDEEKQYWDQDALTTQLEIAASAGTGIIAMKTCSGGPYSCSEDQEPSFPGALKWALDQDYIHVAVPALANFAHIAEHLSMMKG